MLRRFPIFLLPFLATTAFAADPAGRWALRAGDTTLMTFEVERMAHGWAGVWTRPTHFNSDADSYWNMSGPALRVVASKIREVPGGLELTFDDPKPDALPDIFLLRSKDENTAELAYITLSSEPTTVLRARDGETASAWNAARTYLRPVDRPTNAEMTAIFEADQADRAHPGAIDWRTVAPADHARRARTQALLDGDQLRSGDDYYHAAFIFQHGQDSGDYLKAHALALIAAARGKPAAVWIAAATLDRYLQSIGKPQIYGTQFAAPAGTFTQDPYDKSLLSDAVRQASHVPPLVRQEEQRREWQNRLDKKK